MRQMPVHNQADSERPIMPVIWHSTPPEVDVRQPRQRSTVSETQGIRGVVLITGPAHTQSRGPGTMPVPPWDPFIRDILTGMLIHQFASHVDDAAGRRALQVNALHMIENVAGAQAVALEQHG